MSTYDFRILLETVEGQKKHFYYSSSFVDTSTDLVLSASTSLYNRITGSFLASYQNIFLVVVILIQALLFKDNTLLFKCITIR